MNNENGQQNMLSEIDDSDLNYKSMEEILSEQLNDQLSDLNILVEQHEEISNPNKLGQVVLDTVWEQLMNNISIIAGQDFIDSNGGSSLDLRNSAHIQTTENFANGKIASHNKDINYQERFDNMQSKFQKDDQGNIKYNTDKSKKQKQTLTKDARHSYDRDRPVGSKSEGIDKDHTISAAEIMRDTAANAHMTESEMINFANSTDNLHDMKSSHNRSKKDLSTEDWLNLENANGQTPSDIFNDLDEKTQQKYLKDNEEAREAFEKRKSEGEQKSIKSGKKSQRKEAFKIGGKALRAAIMGLLAELVKEIVHQFIQWLKSKNKKMKSLLLHIKKAIGNFMNNLKQHLVNATQSLITTIIAAIYQPITTVFTKLIMVVKQGVKSFKEIISYIKNPDNINKPLSVLSLEVGKMLVVGLSAIGTLTLSEVIEKSLIAIPGFGFQIPLLGSLASILGTLSAGIVSGISGAIILNLIDKLIAKKLKEENILKKIDKRNEIIKTQQLQQDIARKYMDRNKKESSDNITKNHQAAKEMMDDSLNNIFDESVLPMKRNLISDNQSDFDQLQSDLDGLL